MIWTALTVGRQEGLALPQVLFTDPGWFSWAHGRGVFRGPFAIEATKLLSLATRIRIAASAGEHQAVEYSAQPAGGLAAMQLVPATAVVERGGSASLSRSWIDLSIPSQLSPYDKKGDKILIDLL